MACYPSEADFVIRYPEDPSREVTQVEEFQKIRARYEKIRPKSPGRGWTSLKERKIGMAGSTDTGKGASH